MFRIPNGIDPKMKQVLQSIQGEMFKLAKKGGGGNIGGGVSREIVYVTTEDADSRVDGDLYVDGSIDGTLVGEWDGNLTPAVNVVTGSRSVGVAYHNTNSTMMDVRVCVEIQ